MATITNHGAERLMERTKANKISLEKINRIWNSGKKISDFSDNRVKKYLARLESKGGPDRAVRVSGNDAYIFSKTGTLITVLNIANEVRQFNNKARAPKIRDSYEDFDEYDY